MFKWKKLGRIFNPTDVSGKPWLHEFAQCTSTLLFDDFVRVYFSCRPKRDKTGHCVSNTTFLDLDRNDLTKIVRIADRPLLELGELGAFDEFGIYPSCIIKIDDLIHFYYAGWTRMSSVPVNVAIGLAYSSDGESFNRLSNGGPIMSRTPLEPFQVSGPKVRIFNGDMYMFYLAGEKWLPDGPSELYKSETIYKVRLATSKDGVNWERNGHNILNSILDDECQAGPDVFYRDGKYHMYFSYRYGLDFRKNDRGYRIGYASSYDLVSWTRDDKNTGIELSKGGWDSQDMHYPHVFDCDGNTYMLYNGNEFGRYGFGLAILEK